MCRCTPRPSGVCQALLTTCNAIAATQHACAGRPQLHHQQQMGAAWLPERQHPTEHSDTPLTLHTHQPTGASKGSSTCHKRISAGGQLRLQANGHCCWGRHVAVISDRRGTHAGTHLGRRSSLPCFNNSAEASAEAGCWPHVETRSNACLSSRSHRWPLGLG